MKNLTSGLLCLSPPTPHLATSSLSWQTNRNDKAQEFFAKQATELQNQAEWKDWFVLPFLPSPDTNPTFATYFSRQWADTFIVSLHNFLSVLFQCMHILSTARGYGPSLPLALEAIVSSPKCPWTVVMCSVRGLDRLWLFLPAGQEILHLRCDAAKVIADIHEPGQ